MKTHKMLTFLFLVLGLALYSAEAGQGTPMGTGFTYQGQLYDANYPANGSYDFSFKLYDADNDGNQVGIDVNIGDVNVIDGYFTAEMDFGSDVFDGGARWLDVGVRPGDMHDPNSYTLLSPRQEVTPTPYALQTRGIFVDSAGNVGIGTTEPATKLEVAGQIKITGGIPGVNKVLTSDASGLATWQSTLSGLKVYDSGWFAVTANTSYSKAHNLGTTAVHVLIYSAQNSNGTGNSGMMLEGYTITPTGGEAYGIQLYNISTTQVSMFVQPNGFNYVSGLTSPITSGYARIIMLALE